jgi:hypothetical protein
MRALSDLPFVDRSRTPHPTKTEIPTMFCCTNTPRAKNIQESRVHELAKANADLQRAMEIMTQETTPRPATAVPSIIIRRTNRIEEPQEILSYSKRYYHI